MLTEAQLNQLFQYAMVLCQQRDDAYDLLQTCVEKYLIECKCRAEGIDNPMAFLHRLIRNRFIDLYRHQQRWQFESYDELDDGVYSIAPLELENSLIQRDELQQLWGQLSAQERDLLYYWAVLGYSTDEACEILELPRGTFLSRLHRLRKRLQAAEPAEKRS